MEEADHREVKKRGRRSGRAVAGNETSEASQRRGKGPGR